MVVGPDARDRSMFMWPAISATRRILRQRTVDISMVISMTEPHVHGDSHGDSETR